MSAGNLRAILAADTELGAGNVLLRLAEHGADMDMPRVTFDTAMIASALRAYCGTRNLWLSRSMRRDAHGMTYQSRPWHTHAAGQPARSGSEYLGL